MTDESINLTESLLDKDHQKEESLHSSSESFLPHLKKDDFLISSTLTEGSQGLPSPAPIPEEPDEESFERGEMQPPQYRDWPFGVLFHLQFIAILVLGGFYAKTLKLEKKEDQPADYDGNLNLTRIVVPTLISAGTAILLILLSLVVMTRMGKAFITCSVWTSAIVSFSIGVSALVYGMVILGVMSLLSSLIGVCYAIAVRKRIPFAAANLDAGVSSIKSNAGITLVVLFISTLLFGWIFLWTTSLLGLMDIQENCEGDKCDMEVKTWGWSLPLVFFLFWTQQVFKNVIHTTVAGLVGTWFFTPEGASSFCSTAVTTSLVRSLTYSFGSICFGSLCVAIVQTLDFIVNSLRSERNRDGEGNAGIALLLCCLDCILSLLQGVLEFFNKFVSHGCLSIINLMFHSDKVISLASNGLFSLQAFVYVGVYGYPFMTAGKKVMTLFKHRGWTVIINDNLISHALSLICLVVSLLSGIIPLAFVEDDESGGIKVAVFMYVLYFLFYAYFSLL